MLKIGLSLPTAGRDITPQAIAHVAESAEQLGLDSVWTFERLLRPTVPAAAIGGGELELPETYASVYDPLETLAFVAARTSTIQLGTSVVDSVLHPPLVLARRLATLDRLCEGRLLAGIGLGWMVAEYEATGVPTTGRGDRFADHIAAMRAAWGPDPVSYDGEHYRMAESTVGPKPVRPDGPTLLAGSMAPAAVERAARLGLGLNPIMMSWEQLSGTIAAYRETAEAAGHDRASTPVAVRVNGDVTVTPADGEREPLTGGVDQVVEDFGRLEEIGADHVFWTMETSVDDQLATMTALREAYRSA